MRRRQPRLSNRAELENAVRTECRTEIERILGRPWAETEKALKEQLRAALARRHLWKQQVQLARKIRDALFATRQFAAARPSTRVQPESWGSCTWAD
jgi:hypothetical protein